MDVYVDPSPENFARFKALDRDTPILMLNMLRFREAAAYPEDHPQAQEGLTGAEAYARYGETSGPVFSRLGGEIVFRGQFQTTLIGPDAEHWDALFVARYPDAHAFFAMVTDPEYRIAVVHRQAAVATSRLIRMAEDQAGTLFSE